MQAAEYDHIKMRTIICMLSLKFLNYTLRCWLYMHVRLQNYVMCICVCVCAWHNLARWVTWVLTFRTYKENGTAYLTCGVGHDKLEYNLDPQLYICWMCFLECNDNKSKETNFFHANGDKEWLHREGER